MAFAFRSEAAAISGGSYDILRMTMDYIDQGNGWTTTVIYLVRDGTTYPNSSPKRKLTWRNISKQP